MSAFDPKRTFPPNPEYRERPLLADSRHPKLDIGKIGYRMRADYVSHHSELKRGLLQQGAVLLCESELMAEYRLSSGWMLRFVCEKCDGPSWSIDIAPSAGGPWFAVWLLMQAFERLTGAHYGAPTINAQVCFLDSEASRLFDEDAFYAAEYARLNRVDGME